MDSSSYQWYVPFSYQQQHLPSTTQPSSKKPLLTFSIDRILEPLYKCDDCKMSFKQRVRFDFHKCLFCRPCRKLFTRRNYLNEHIRVVHEGGLPRLDRFICDYCGASSANKLSIERHMREKHLRMERRYQCDLCPQSFNLKFRLSTHMIVHKASLFCEMCQHYYSRAYFMRHVRDIHGTAHNHSCDVCLRRFKSLKMLRHHESTHLKRFECGICGKKYAYRHHFESHVSRHQKRRDYQCALCKGRFGSVALLKVHLQHHIDCEKFQRNVLMIGRGCSGEGGNEEKKGGDEVIVIDSD